MNILKRYTVKIAKIVFGSKISRQTLENRAYVSYAFIVDKDLASTLNPGDYVAVESMKGLFIGVFIGFSYSKYDMQIATKPIVCKIENYTVDYEF